jgi:hypothetical protein
MVFLRYQYDRQWLMMVVRENLVIFNSDEKAGYKQDETEKRRTGKKAIKQK